jgi:hypothetical protein
MTMAPGRKKRSFVLEIIFISILLFLLLGSRSQQAGGNPGADLKSSLQPGFAITPGMLK